MLQGFLIQLGFTPVECQIYLALAEIGAQPASIVAKRCGLDRVTTYKHLKKLAERGFIKISYHTAIQTFGVESIESLEAHLRQREHAVQEMIEAFPTAANLLASMRKGQDLVPKLQIYEGEAGMRGLFRDVLFEAKESGIRQIRMLTSNTFDERLGDTPLSRYVGDFFEDVRTRGLDLEVLEATGTLLPERLRRRDDNIDPTKLPAARGATNVFIVGHAVYLACYKQSQVGLKIKQAELSQIFHFLFDMLRRTSTA